MKKLIYILILALVSCGSSHTDEPTPIVPVEPVSPDTPDADKPMAFAPFESTVSRAGTPLNDVYSLFKVFTYKHTPSTTTETVMPGYQVKYLDDSFLWQYDGTTYTAHPEIANQFLKFWDASALSYDFYAYAPVNLPAGIDLSIDADKGFSITTLSAHTTTLSDIVVAKHERHINDAKGLKDIDAIVNSDNVPQPAAFHDRVPLHFHHLLSKVEYRIYNTGDKTAVIDNVLVRLGNGNTYATSGDFDNDKWTNLSSSLNYLYSANYVEPNLLKVEPLAVADYPKYKELSTPLGYYYEIPQPLYNEMQVSLDIEGAVVSRTFEIPNNAWEIDRNYVYYIHIDVNSGENTPILISLTLEDFMQGDPINETQTNW